MLGTWEAGGTLDCSAEFHVEKDFRKETRNYKLKTLPKTLLKILPRFRKSNRIGPLTSLFVTGHPFQKHACGLLYKKVRFETDHRVIRLLGMIRFTFA